MLSLSVTIWTFGYQDFIYSLLKFQKHHRHYEMINIQEYIAY